MTWVWLIIALAVVAGVWYVMKGKKGAPKSEAPKSEGPTTPEA